jgi:hypothetical protein
VVGDGLCWLKGSEKKRVRLGSFDATGRHKARNCDIRNSLKVFREPRGMMTVQSIERSRLALEVLRVDSLSSPAQKCQLFERRII